MEKIKIIGCGSLLMGDDAIGCIIARELKKIDLPENIKIIEAGTPGLNLLSMMNSDEFVVIIDAVVTGKNEEGTLAIYREGSLPKPSEMPLSAHQVAIPEAIALGRKIQPELMPPEIEIWGIEIKTPIVKKMELSENLALSVSIVISEVKKRFCKEVQGRKTFCF